MDSAAENWEPKEGELIDGKYRLRTRERTTPFTEVFLAENTVMGTTVALTVLKPPQTELAALASFLDRFLQEFNFVSRVDHENVVRVLDFGIFERRAFLVTAGSEGTTVRSLLTAEGKVAPERVASIANQISAALSAAHQGGIIHGDLQPDSIFLVPSAGGIQVCKVADFALAKVLRGDDSTLAILTRTGKTVGSPYYMSPEIFRGKPGDARSDVYSMGIVLYELLCGHVPFRSESMMDLLLQHLNDPPPPIARTPEENGIPDALALVIEKTLEKNPVNRYESIWAVTQALREAFDYTGAPPENIPEPDAFFMQDANPAPAAEGSDTSAEDTFTVEEQIPEPEQLFLTPPGLGENEVTEVKPAPELDLSGLGEDSEETPAPLIDSGFLETTSTAADRPANEFEDSRFRRAVSRYERGLARKREIRRKRLILAGSIAAFVITVTIFFIGLYQYVEANKPVSTFVAEQEQAAATTAQTPSPEMLNQALTAANNSEKPPLTEPAPAVPAPEELLAAEDQNTPVLLDEIGITVRTVTEAAVKEYKLRTVGGLVITGIAETGHPARTKFKKGDVIKRIETKGEPVTKWRPFEVNTAEQIREGIKQAKDATGKLSLLLRRGDGKDILVVLDLSADKPAGNERKKAK